MRATALRIVRRLREAGHEALLAGGCVRDRLRGVEPADHDVATSARPEHVQALFPRTVAVGAAFGVILVVEDGEEVEVATFREDVGVLDGRHPAAVRFADARADALRRDFTVNGMFEDPETGEIFDFVGGRADLEAPEEDQEQIDEMLDSLQDGIDSLEEDWQNPDNEAFANANKIANDYGFKECGEDE